MNIEVSGESDMRTLGAKLGALLRGGELIELVGDVGAGKTTLTKGIAAGMGIDDDIQSPSFTISRLYDAPSGLHLAHYDFYRLLAAGIMADELRETINDSQTVTVIEWAELIVGVLPDDRLTMTITLSADNEHARHVSVVSSGHRSGTLLKELA
jgi:tRNA threonylcarbamoyladenosine biosynthesis protein TsaE